MILAGCGTGGADQPAVTPQAGTDGQSASATLDNTTEESESSRQSPAVDDEELASAERVSGEEALLTNARLYADAVGISLEDALAQFQVQEELGRLELEPALRATAGDDFAGIWIQRDPAGAGDCGAGGGGGGEGGVRTREVAQAEARARRSGAPRSRRRRRWIECSCQSTRICEATPIEE